MTAITYDPQSGTLSVKTRYTSRSQEAEGGVYSLRYGGVGRGRIELRIFVDDSVIEVFINDEQCISARAYPESSDATGVKLVTSDGQPRFASVEAWQVRPGQLASGETASGLTTG
jgi:sucrose-6-phosphate hydrolase SacC (GH32 family)